MKPRTTRGLAFAVLLALAGCGSLPHPFEGNPGATAMRLAQPPPSRLAVPRPGAAFLAPDAADQFAGNLANALADQEIPAIAGAAHRGEWQVLASAVPQGGNIVPQFKVEDERGHTEGTVDGTPIDAAVWIRADPAMLKQAAADVAPRIAAMLTQIDAARRQSDPNSLLNRPSKLAFLGVTGAPGDGNSSLAAQMRTELPKLGQLVQDSPSGADFVLRCTVKTAPVGHDQMSVEITWTIDDPQGNERGRVVQLNELQAGTLDHYWGDIASVVAREAAGGVREAIVRQTGNTRPAAGTPAAAAAPANPPPSPPPGAAKS